MTLTRLQKGLQKEVEGIAEITKLDYQNIQERWKYLDSKWRTVAYRMTIVRMVTAEVINRYTLFDEILADYLCRYFFKKPGQPFILWRQKKFRLFVHYILDEMYLLKKMQMVHAIKPLPKEVRGTITKVNAVRNAIAHSLFPENRKEYRGAGKVLYSGKDINTREGLELFIDECSDAYDYLWKKVFRN